MGCLHAQGIEAKFSYGACLLKLHTLRVFFHKRPTQFIPCSTGLKKDEIIAIISTTTSDAGFPVIFNALFTAQALFTEPGPGEIPTRPASSMGCCVLFV